jgi:hypothetical protein
MQNYVACNFYGCAAYFIYIFIYADALYAVVRLLAVTKGDVLTYRK